MTQKLIILAAGGTGGHMMPALATGQDLTHQGHQPFYVIDQRVEPYMTINDERLVLPLLRPRLTSFGFWKSLVQSFIQVWCMFRKMKPAGVIAFGGYCCLPTMLAAVMLRVPLYLHEQNAILGKAHRLFLFFSKKLFLSFPDTLAIPPRYAHKCFLTGLPVRPEFYEEMKTPPTPRPDFFHILILGGSQGAALFSHLIPEALRLLPEDLQKKCKVYQQCRAEMIEGTQEKYTGFKGTVLLKPFFTTMAFYIREAQVIISRAGASTLAELEVMKKKALFIPLKTAIYDHQTLNATSQCHRGGGWMLDEATLTPHVMADFIHNRYTEQGQETQDFICVKSFNKQNMISLLDFL